MSEIRTQRVLIYSPGLIHCSICAPIGMEGEDVLKEVNQTHPTGLDHGWLFSHDKNFSTGQSNPCPCEKSADRIHYLLEC